MSPETA